MVAAVERDVASAAGHTLQVDGATGRRRRPSNRSAARRPAARRWRGDRCGRPRAASPAPPPAARRAARPRRAPPASRSADARGSSSVSTGADPVTVTRTSEPVSGANVTGTLTGGSPTAPSVIAGRSTVRDSPPASIRTCVGTECWPSATTCRSRWSKVTGCGRDARRPTAPPARRTRCSTRSSDRRRTPTSRAPRCRRAGAATTVTVMPPASASGIPSSGVEHVVGRVGGQPGGAARRERARVGHPEAAHQRDLVLRVPRRDDDGALTGSSGTRADGRPPSRRPRRPGRSACARSRRRARTRAPGASSCSRISAKPTLFENGCAELSPTLVSASVMSSRWNVRRRERDRLARRRCATRRRGHGDRRDRRRSSGPPG